MSLPRISLLSVLTLFASCGNNGENFNPTGSSSSTTTTPKNRTEHLPGGDTTIMSNLASAFEQHSQNMTDPERIRQFNVGNDFFKNPWVPNRSSTSSRDGLGPHFNNNACQDCHIRDGRGHAPNISTTEAGDDFSSILIRAAKTDISNEQRSLILSSMIPNVGDSAVGGQLQQEATAGIQAETNLHVNYEERVVTFSDGYEVILRKPIWHLESNLAADGYDFDTDTVFSARVAPPMIGLGLLELISEQDILSRLDHDDIDQDGISGKANYVWSIEKNAIELGRFGWKAGQPNVKEQAAGAFLGDMGLTSALHPNENCMAHQSACLAAPNGNGDSTQNYDYEVSDIVLNNVAFYSSHIAVPARRNAYSTTVTQGKALFMQAGCESCHRESYTTQTSLDFPELSAQLIYPYTDMLLHDMGEQLADFTIDNRAVGKEVLFEYLATAREWRTAPLWGIGLTKTIDPRATFLHDGRARTILEAILWHDGEALASKNNVLNFSKVERAALLAFLNDL